MSDRRKKDRYNETWTKEELTESLRKHDKRSSHRSEKSSRHHDEDKYSSKKERKQRGEGEDSRHKSRSDKLHSSEKYRVSEDQDRERRHRSKRDEEGSSDRNERNRKSDRDKVDKYHEANGEDRHRSSRDRNKRDSRHREEGSSKDHNESTYDNNKDEYYRRKHSSKGDDGHSEKAEGRRHRKHENDRHEKSERRQHGEDRSKVDSRDRHRKYREREHRPRDEDNIAKMTSYEKKDRRRREERSEVDSEGHHRKPRKREHRTKEEDDDEDRRMRREIRDREMEAEYEHRKKKEHKEKEYRHGRHNKSDRHSAKYSDSGRDHRDSRREKHHKEPNTEQHENSSSISTNSKKSGHSGHNTEDKLHDKDNEAEEYNYDDEEFEDYADDFEDDNKEYVQNSQSGAPDEMDELMRAIAAENERANSAQSSSRLQSTMTSDRNDSPYSLSSSNEDGRKEGSKSSSTSGGKVGMINFSAAKKSSASNKVRKRMMKRSKDLMNLIQLDSVSFDLLDMAPVTEYNLYIKNYGNSNTTQASVQCNEDNLDQDIQTDIPDQKEKWSQHPPHDVKCSGDGDLETSTEECYGDDRERMLVTMRGDSKRLARFLSCASKLIESILNEDEMWKMSSKENNQKSKFSFCEGFVSLQTNLAYLQGRDAVHISSSQGSSYNLIAVAFKPASTSFSTRIDRKGLVAVWDTRKPAIPEKILVCDACPTHCSFGPSKTHILFVGADDGSILAYDLRESGAHHQVVSLEKTRETILRSPTYTTGYLPDGHSSPIVSIMPVGTKSKFGKDKQIVTREVDNRTRSGFAFQLASLEEAASLSIWIVVEIMPESGLDDDLGLAPHGRIKLLRSLSFIVPSPVKSYVPGLLFRTTCVQFSSTDPNNFYVGTDTGHIIHCTQYSVATDDKNGRANKNRTIFFNEIDAVSAVTSIDINPFQLFGASLILAGYEDGSLRLYLSDRELPVISWPFSTDGSGIAKVQWSSSRPSVFFILDSSHKLHIWDLAIMHAGPIKTEESPNKPICHFSLSNASPSQTPEVALAYGESTSNDISMVEVHKLAPHFSQVTDNDEFEQLTFLLQSLV